MKAINGDGLESDSTKSTLQRVAKRFKFIIIEKDLEFLRCGLHRLESTLLLVVNVIRYAGQVRGWAYFLATALLYRT
jgi:hypothetical protein